MALAIVMSTSRVSSRGRIYTVAEAGAARQRTPTAGDTGKTRARGRRDRNSTSSDPPRGDPSRPHHRTISASARELSPWPGGEGGSSPANKSGQQPVGGHPRDARRDLGDVCARAKMRRRARGGGVRGGQGRGRGARLAGAARGGRQESGAGVAGPAGGSRRKGARDGGGLGA